MPRRECVGRPLIADARPLRHVLREDAGRATAARPRHAHRLRAPLTLLHEYGRLAA